MRIRDSGTSDRAAINAVHASAFGLEQGREIIDLVGGLLDDVTARPLLSLVAEVDGCLAGHILFTAANIQSVPDISARILAPLAVSNALQGKGVGGALINEGLKQLTVLGVDLVLVLGHPLYYPRFGFQPAGAVGIDAPYPIPPEHADAWMVRELVPGVVGNIVGRVRCSEVLNQPQHWRE